MLHRLITFFSISKLPLQACLHEPKNLGSCVCNYTGHAEFKIWTFFPITLPYSWFHLFSYVAVETVNNEVYVCTRRAALNMAYQEMLKSGKSVEPIAELPGVDLMGAQLKGTVKWVTT